MRRLGNRCWLFMGAWTLALALTAPGTASAKEPFDEFLDGLRRRQMFDVARDYLESMRTSRLISDEVKITIPFQLGRTMVEEARTVRNVRTRLELLDQARAQFEQFLAQQSQHPLAADTSLELGNVLVERGRAMVEAAGRAKDTAERDKNMTEARQFFGDAEKVFADAETRFDEELKQYPAFIDSKEQEKIEARNRALLNLMQARLLKATVVYETAGTYPEGSSERTKRLEEATKAYAAIYEQYQRRLAGLYARMYQARCFQDLGNTKQALTYYNELLAQPDDPDEFRVLKRKVLRLALQCWLSDNEKKYDEVVRLGESWLQQARGAEPQTAEGLAIRWLTARAYELRALGYEENAPSRGNELKRAVALATEVAKDRGDHQEDARALIARLRPRENDDGAPADFAAALAAGKAALDAMSTAQTKIRLLERTAAEEQQLAAARDELAAAELDGLRHFHTALSMRTTETSIDEINQVRYFLCYLHYVTGGHYEAAVLGEFLLARYPSSAGAKPAAKIALASYLALYNAAPVEDRSFETARMVEVAERLGKQWPSSEEADEAWIILSDLALRAERYAEAAQRLEQIGADSPRRGEADVKAGQALWAAYLEAARREENRPSAADLQKMMSDAQARLESGLRARIEGKESSPATYVELAAELSLAQIYLEIGQYDRAIALVERPETGALALLAAKSELTAQGNFSSEAYKAALRAYVGAGQLDKAEQVMRILDSQAAESPESAAALTRIYVSLGLELKEQVARLRQEQKDAELKTVLKTFNEFLDRIAKREQGNTYGSLTWVGETYFSLGDGLDSGAAPSPEAKAYYDRAARTFERILQRGISDPAFLPEGASPLAMRLRLARCERRLGSYPAALKQIALLLGEQPSSLEGQIEAAYLFQDWGADDPEYYARANRGRKLKLSDGRIVEVWGWNGLAARVRDNARFRDTYYLAQYNLADCSYRRGMTKTGPDRAAELNATTKVISVLAQLHPDLGGDAWRAKFDNLLKLVQRELGQRPIGLPALESPDATPSTARRAS